MKIAKWIMMGVLTFILIGLTACSHVIQQNTGNNETESVEELVQTEMMKAIVSTSLAASTTPDQILGKTPTAEVEEIFVETFTPPPTNSPTTTSTPEPSLTYTSTAIKTSTMDNCQENHGEITTFSIQSDLVGYKVTGRIYTPPCYNPDYSGGYPAIYLLHGQSFTDDQWDRLGADEISDELILNGDSMPFIIVMPMEKYYLEDPATSTFNIALLDVILPWVDENYATCKQASCRAIGGISRGSAWAMHLGLTNWNLFGAIGAHSFPPFRGDVYNLPYWYQDIPLDQRPRIMIDIGRFDPYLESAVMWEEWMTEYKVPHEWHLNDGTHNEDYWQSHIEEYLKWYTQTWQVDSHNQ